jgi:glycosyltransferase involved in cell wall biosynthesis
MEKMTVCLLNDSFPPTIDGVANATLNYARCIQKSHGRAIVATPWYPRVKDNYPFTVIRYASAAMTKRLGYRGGFPFDPKMQHYLSKQGIDVIHTHCPFMSTLVARMLRYNTGAPIVFTYHTKFDMDIEKRVALNPVRSASLKLLMNNINACDEVWVVSEGAGENLRSLGYEGDYIVMENGVDFERRRTDEAVLAQMRQEYRIRPEQTVFLFVGRMMWYKGVRISIDGLSLAKKQGAQFKMFFVGDGADRKEIEEYCKEVGIYEDCVFTGAIQDREKLRSYFSLGELFLFPSTYDTNGIVVREAAACSCPAILIKGSCAAEGITDGRNGILIEENGPSMAEAILAACADREKLKEIGVHAAEEIYLSWDEAVDRAAERYQTVIARYTREKHARVLEQEMKELREIYAQRKSQYVRKYYRIGRKLTDGGWKEARQRVRQIVEEKHNK